MVGERSEAVTEPIILEDGTKEWRKYGKLHREGGPAIELADGDKEWWIRGVIQEAPNDE